MGSIKYLQQSKLYGTLNDPSENDNHIIKMYITVFNRINEIITMGELSIIITCII